MLCTRNGTGKRGAQAANNSSVPSVEPESMAKKSHDTSQRCAASAVNTRSRNSMPCQVGISTETLRIGRMGRVVSIGYCAPVPTLDAMLEGPIRPRLPAQAPPTWAPRRIMACGR